MKNSYFSTPRRMSDATFHAWGDPIEMDPDRAKTHPADIALLVVLVLGLIAWGIWP